MNQTQKFSQTSVTTDAVIFKLNNKASLQVLLIQRKNDPFKLKWALPGGFLENDETLEECVSREIEEETGLTGLTFHQLEAFSSPNRDPRGRVITIVFWAFLTNNPLLNPDSDALKAKWFDINHLPELAFDHDAIIKRAVKRALELIADNLS